MKQLTARAALPTLAVILLSIVIGCGGRPVLTNLTSHELFDKGKEQYQKENYINAIEYFQAIVYNYPGESIVDTAQYYLALAYFGNEEYELAQVEFNRLLLNYPSSVYFEHSVFMKAASFYEGTPRHYGLDQSDLQTAIKQFEDFIIDYPEAELIEQAQQYLLSARTRMAKKYYKSAETYKLMGAHQAAIKYYQVVIDDYTDTEFGPLATFYIAEMEYKRRDYVKARNGYEGFVAAFPEHELAPEAAKRAAEAAFKSGQAAFKKGDVSDAKERLEGFVKDYPDHNKVDEAQKLLIKINNLPPPDGEGDDANS